MKKILSSLAAGVIALGVATYPALAAGSSRTFVSGAGTDTGSCPLTAPCRTFAYALTQTAPSGEIIVLSSAGYGAVTITQAVSIINTGNYAGVTVASGDGIIINAGPSDSVVLRGISVDGGGTGSNGIVFISGSRLTIDQCDVLNFLFNGGATGYGILVQPASSSHTITITNTTASHNGNAGVAYVPSSGSTATSAIVIDRVTASNNTNYGIAIDDSSSMAAAAVSISNSIASGNSTGYYFKAIGASLDASYAASNGFGVYIDSGTLTVGRAVLVNNSQYGLFINGGTVNSYKDNRISGGQTVNVTPGTAPLF